MKRFLGISRERIFSPGRVADDRAIIEAVANRLREEGHAVSLLDADGDDWPEPVDGTIVFTMCQGTIALDRLQRWVARGLRVINHPEGILRCQRHRTVAALSGGSVAFPQTILVSTDSSIDPPLWLAGGGGWLKRGDAHALEAEDVVRIDDVAALRAALHRFQARGVRRVVLQRHVPGTVLKFYAVRGRFFHCVPPVGDLVLSPDVSQRIDCLGQEASRRLQVEIYGGDCVYDSAGGLTLIDLNDWPSYAPCRVQGARAIAAYLDAQTVTTET